MQKSVNAPTKQAPVIPQWVWFGGSTALSEGQGVCYYFDYGTADEIDGRRLNHVELPSITNARYFAGVAARDYSAKTGGQFIEIYGPGSACNILAKADCTLGTGILTCEAGGTYAGYFRYAGFEGEGSAVPLQTVDRSETAGKVFSLLQTGNLSGLVEVVTAAAGAYAAGWMVGGVTYLIGADIAQNMTADLEDGTVEELLKQFQVITTAVTTAIVNIDLASAGLKLDGSTAMNDIQLDAISEKITVQWSGGIWITRGKSGGATEA